MPSEYSKSIDYLYGLQWHGIKLGLENIEKLAGKLGGPQTRIPAVHIAGTNGKGSTAAMMESVLRTAGISNGLYTSPHLRDFTERIRVNGVPISEEAVTGLTGRIRGASAGIPLTFFEFTTAMAFSFLEEKKVQVGIFETGMGGRFDATNILTPAVSVITNVDFDHQAHLGRTLSEIAFEKSGIIKKGVPVVTAAERSEALETIEGVARERGAPVYRLPGEFSIVDEGGGRFTYKGLHRHIGGLQCGLEGDHQRKNAACAIAALELLAPILPEKKSLSDEIIRRGLAGVRWPGRLEPVHVPPGGREIILDGAHNPAAARALRNALRGTGGNKENERFILVLGMLHDKDAEGILKELVPLASHIIATRPAYERALPVKELKERLSACPVPVSTAETVPAALRLAEKTGGAGDRVLVTGSLFTVGEARSVLLGLPGPSPVVG